MALGCELLKVESLCLTALLLIHWYGLQTGGTLSTRLLQILLGTGQNVPHLHQHRALHHLLHPSLLLQLPARLQLLPPRLRRILESHRTLRLLLGWLEAHLQLFEHVFPLVLVGQALANAHPLQEPDGLQAFAQLVQLLPALAIRVGAVLLVAAVVTHGESRHGHRGEATLVCVAVQRVEVVGGLVRVPVLGGAGLLGALLVEDEHVGGGLRGAFGSEVARLAASTLAQVLGLVQAGYEALHRHEGLLLD